MPINETGHARNVQHFESLISFVTAYGIPYAPSNTDLTVLNLNTVLTDAQGAIDDVSQQVAASKTAINDRENAFAPLKRLATRIVNYYASTGAEANAIEDARGYKRKIDGRRKKAVVPDDPNTPEDESAANISASQQSYTQQIEHFDALINLVGNDPLYVPNENDIKMIQLNAYSTTLKNENTGVIGAFTQLSNSRIARNNVMYFGDTALVDLAFLVKKYVKAVFGAASPEFHQISGLKFTRPKG